MGTQTEATSLLQDGGIHQNEDSGLYTRDGSVDIKGNPVLKSETGNWRACPFILGNECCERLAFYGISVNLVTYLTKKLHEGNVSAARNVTTWQGTCYLMPLIGAVLADAYWGRYRTIATFSIIYFVMKNVNCSCIYFISGLPLDLSAKESVFSLASAVGKPLTVDMTTDSLTRLSCARLWAILKGSTFRIRLSSKKVDGATDQWIVAHKSVCSKGVLYFIASDDFPIDEDVMNVPEVLDEVSCNAGTHSHCLSEDIASHIIHEIQPPKFVDTHIWKILHLTMMVRYVSTFNSFEEGMCTLTLSASVPDFKPPECVGSVCPSATPAQYAIFFSGLYLIALGTGGIKPCVSAFGADQFDDTDPKERVKKGSFFNWFYFSINIGALISSTLIVWIQENAGWGLGFGIPAVFMSIAIASFFFGTPLYRFQKPGGSPLTRMCQVLVAAFHKWNLSVPDDSTLLYETPDKSSAIEGSRKLLHTDELR
ncbi:hypothetical protein MTR67_051133 [Solanum verrucosum]|uniref:Peptide transporter n=1 Tax=Solanum verrucosum TaxID=315347 RepID=A0AAF0V6R1_SOLVR|nr:hypothetical protein MTR67_051133 [Solanum verrucosum]